MKEVKLEDIRKRNKERKELGIEAARRVDKDYYPGKRKDRYYGRKDKVKGRILEEMGKEEKGRENKRRK